MKADDILRMAREAGLLVPTYRDHITHLERFAALVAAAEREACAISCEVNAARWIDSGGKQWGAAHECADAIRARGTK